MNNLFVGTNEAEFDNLVHEKINLIHAANQHQTTVSNKITVIDTNGSFSAEYSNIANVCKLGVQSLQTINPFDAPENIDFAIKCEQAVAIAESIFRRECTPYEYNTIHRAFGKMYEKALEEKKAPTLAAFYEHLIDDQTPEGCKIAMAIEPYATGNCNLFSRQTNIKNSNANSGITIIDISEIPYRTKGIAAIACLNVIWNEVAQADYRDRDYVWAYIPFDLFNTRASKICLKDMLIRTKPCHILGMVRSLSDFINEDKDLGYSIIEGFEVNIDPLTNSPLINVK